jgi:hypothetical protein
MLAAETGQLGGSAIVTHGNSRESRLTTQVRHCARSRREDLHAYGKATEWCRYV